MAAGADRGSIIALAGRRVDATDAPQPRFPLGNVPKVRTELAELFRPGAVRALVCSAASGADLLALDAAGNAGIKRHVVLPFDRATFRSTSVVDRPGDWGPLFDRIVSEIDHQGGLEVGSGDPDDPEVYLRANERIVSRALELANVSPRISVVVWEGAPRGTDDVTDDFRRRAEQAGFESRFVLTL